MMDPWGGSDWTHGLVVGLDTFSAKILLGSYMIEISGILHILQINSAQIYSHRLGSQHNNSASLLNGIRIGVITYRPYQNLTSTSNRERTN